MLYLDLLLRNVIIGLVVVWELKLLLELSSSRIRYQVINNHGCLAILWQTFVIDIDYSAVLFGFSPFLGFLRKDLCAYFVWFEIFMMFIDLRTDW